MEIEDNMVAVAEYLKGEVDVVSQFTKTALKKNPELKTELLSLLMDISTELPAKINEISLPVINNWSYCPHNGGNVDGEVYNHETLSGKLINTKVIEIDFKRGFVIDEENIFYLGMKMRSNV